MKHSQVNVTIERTPLSWISLLQVEELSARGDLRVEITVEKSKIYTCLHRLYERESYFVHESMCVGGGERNHSFCVKMVKWRNSISHRVCNVDGNFTFNLTLSCSRGDEEKGKRGRELLFISSTRRGERKEYIELDERSSHTTLRSVTFDGCNETIFVPLIARFLRLSLSSIHLCDMQTLSAEKRREIKFTLDLMVNSIWTDVTWKCFRALVYICWVVFSPMKVHTSYKSVYLSRGVCELHEDLSNASLVQWGGTEKKNVPLTIQLVQLVEWVSEWETLSPSLPHTVRFLRFEIK